MEDSGCHMRHYSSLEPVFSVHMQSTSLNSRAPSGFTCLLGSLSRSFSCMCIYRLVHTFANTITRSIGTLRRNVAFIMLFGALAITFLLLAIGTSTLLGLDLLLICST